MLLFIFVYSCKTIIIVDFITCCCPSFCFCYHLFFHPSGNPVIVLTIIVLAVIVLAVIVLSVIVLAVIVLAGIVLALVVHAVFVIVGCCIENRGCPCCCC